MTIETSLPEPLYLVSYRKANSLPYAFIGDVKNPIHTKERGEELLKWMNNLIDDEDNDPVYSLVTKSFLLEQYNSVNLYLGVFTKEQQKEIVQWLTAVN